METVLGAARNASLADLRKRGFGYHADAIVGVTPSASEISGKGTLMVMVAASATAVRLVDRPPPF